MNRKKVNQAYAKLKSAYEDLMHHDTKLCYDLRGRLNDVIIDMQKLKDECPAAVCDSQMCASLPLEEHSTNCSLVLDDIDNGGRWQRVGVATARKVA